MKEKQKENNHETHSIINPEVMQETTKEGQNTSSSFEEEANKYKDLWMRAVAEMDNLRKRTLKEKEEAQKYGVTTLARDVLTIADNLKRALSFAPKNVELSNEVKALVDGITLIDTEIKNMLDRHGIKEVFPLGEIFNPHFHQAMFEVPESEEYKPGTIAQVIQSGYIIHDRLLRPALVGVAKATKNQQNEAK
jgi:molecular chaperone GrpE